MSILHDILIQKIIPIELFGRIKIIKLMESPVSVPPQSMMFFFLQKTLNNFEIPKTYEDHDRFTQDFRWITIMIHSISDSNYN